MPGNKSRRINSMAKLAYYDTSIAKITRRTTKGFGSSARNHNQARLQPHGV